jgi:hypothetical protein
MNQNAGAVNTWAKAHIQGVLSLDDHHQKFLHFKPSLNLLVGMTKLKIVHNEQTVLRFTVFFELPESETDHMLESRDNLETHWDAKVGPCRRSTGQLLGIWRV